MDIGKLFEIEWVTRLIKSVVVIVGAIIIKLISNALVKRWIGKGRMKASKSGKMYMKLIRDTSKYALIVIVLIMLLQINGIDVSSMVAGVGIGGLVIGVAIQDSLKDVIRGFDIISKEYYKVGDVIRFGDVMGEVMTIGMKTTKVHDLNTLNVVSIANRNIEEVEVVSDMIDIDVPLPYELKVADAEEILAKIVEGLKTQEKINNSEYRGVSEFGDSAINYRIKVYCEPINKVQVRRDALTAIMKGVESAGVAVPYMQVDIHGK